MTPVSPCSFLIDFTSAIAIPPRVRVNFNCYPRWNFDRSDLDVVWNGTVFERPWTSGHSICEGYGRDYILKYDFQYFCTDTGAAGFFNNSFPNATLSFKWLENYQAYHQLSLLNKSTTSWVLGRDYLSRGSVTVVGSRVYLNNYYNISGSWMAPRLSSIVVSPYYDGAKPSDLLYWGFRGVSILGQVSDWSVKVSGFLYPGSDESVTASLESEQPVGRAWVIDAVLYPRQTAVHHESYVHHPMVDIESRFDASRDVLTVPGYTCHAFTNGSAVHCVAITEGRYTWSEEMHNVFGMSFVPLSGGFELPATLFLLDDSTERRDVYRLLSGPGFLSPLAFSGSTLFAVEQQSDSSCPSGFRLFFFERALPDLQKLSAQELNCVWEQVLDGTPLDEPPLAGSVVKWAGPWAENTVILTAVSIKDHEYYLRGSTEAEWPGTPSPRHIVTSRRSFIQLATDAAPLSCPLLQNFDTTVDSVSDVAVASAVKFSRSDCLRCLMRTENVDVTATYVGHPLILWAERGEMVVDLVNYGAGIEQKDETGLTAMAKIVSGGGNPLLLLEAGAAVCTWPRNVYSEPHDEFYDIQPPFIILSVYMNKQEQPPCEPGFFVEAGPECTGLTFCPAGFFCPGYRAMTNQKHPCPSGTYYSGRGAQSAVQCRPCPPERPYSAPGSTDSGDCSITALNTVYTDSELHIAPSISPSALGEYGGGQNMARTLTPRRLSRNGCTIV